MSFALLGSLSGFFLFNGFGKKNKLFGFISGIPVHLNVNGKDILMAEINFLCVHKNLRTKRLAPVLIKEVTRRVNRCNIW